MAKSIQRLHWESRVNVAVDYSTATFIISFDTYFLLFAVVINNEVLGVIPIVIAEFYLFGVYAITQETPSVVLAKQHLVE
jgi:hypothetical protein